MAIRDLYTMRGKRRLPVDPRRLQRMQEILSQIDPGLDIDVVSGGQVPKGTRGSRTGSIRHDIDPHTGMGSTADIVFSRQGRQILPSQNRELYAQFIRNAAPEFPGIGHYSWGIHVGSGSPVFWGPTTHSASADPYFAAAYKQGRQGNARQPLVQRVGDYSYSQPQREPYDNRYDGSLEYGEVKDEKPKTRMGKISGVFAEGSDFFGRMNPAPPEVAQSIDYTTTGSTKKVGDIGAPGEPAVGAGKPLMGDFGPTQPAPLTVDWDKIGWYARNAFKELADPSIFGKMNEDPHTQSFFRNALAWSWNHLTPWNAAQDLGQGLGDAYKAGREKYYKAWQDAGDWTGQQFRELTQMTEEERAAQQEKQGQEQGQPTSSGTPFILPSAGGETSPAGPGGGVTSTDITIPGTNPPKPPTYQLPPATPPPTIGYPPEPTLEQPFDYNPYLERLRQFRPPEFNQQQYKRQNLLSTLSRAFAQGAKGSGWSGAGGVLARVGAGFGEGEADVSDEARRRYDLTEESQRRFDIEGLSTEMQLAQKAGEVTQRNIARQDVAKQGRYKVDVENQANQYNYAMQRKAAEVTFANQATKELYEYDKELYHERAPQVLNPTKDGFVVKYVDNEGNIHIKVNRYGDHFGAIDDDELKRLKEIQTTFKDQPMVAQTDMYTFLIGHARWPAVAEMIARETVEKGAAQRFVDPAVYEATSQKAMDAMSARRIQEGTDKFYEEFPKMMAQLLMPYMYHALTDEAQLQALENENIMGASILLHYLRANQPRSPLPTIPGPGSMGGPR